MNFKDMVEADIKGVFLNADEFAEKHKVIYDDELFDGEDHEGISIVLTKVKETKHTVIQAEGVEGIHKVSAVVHISLNDMNGKVPEQKQMISIDDGEAAGHPFFQKYRIVTSDVEMGMICLELEAFDE